MAVARALLSFSCLLGLAVLAGAPSLPQPAIAAERAADPGSLANLYTSLRAVPVEIHRRAADALEIEREREGSPWLDARLSSDVLPMHRPGQDAIAYYEVGVEGPDGEPRGYMVLSADRHDYPIAFSTSTGPRRSTELAAALPAGREAARVHYLGPVSTVAEGDDGKALASLGDLPPRVEHAEMAWLDLPAEARAGHTHWDGYADALVEARPRHEIELGTWDSWTQLREEYVDNYAVLHEALRRGAIDDWEDEDAFHQMGEGLQSGWFREIPILDRGGVTLAVRGEGAPYVRLRQDERIYEGDQAAVLFVEDIDREGVFEVEVAMAYADGTEETHRFDVTHRIGGSQDAAPPRGELGLAARNVLAAPTAVAAPECTKVVIRSPWDTYLFARNGGGSTIEAKGGWIGSWEIFRLHAVGRNHVELQAANGDWIWAPNNGGGALMADGLNRGGGAQFQRHKYSDGTVAFRAKNGSHFMRAHQNGMVDVKATAVGGWEKFELEYCQPERLDGRWAGNDPIDAYRQVRKYDQLSGHVSPNNSGCASGCGATVWAMVFGWADHMAARGDKTWLGAAGIYKKDNKTSGPDEGAPEWMWTDVPSNLSSSKQEHEVVEGPASMVVQIRDKMNDWGLSGCTVTGSRFTAPHIMGQASQWLKTRVNTKLTSDYDGAGIMTHEGKTKARQRLVDKQVVAIGIGHLSHYPLAYGWEDARFHAWNKGTRRWENRQRHKRFVVHMGWGHPGSSNVPYDTWFQGWIDPPKYSTAVTTMNGSASIPKPAPKPLPTTDKPLNPKPKGPMLPKPNLWK